jgi:hypothetical protein
VLRDVGRRRPRWLRRPAPTPVVTSDGPQGNPLAWLSRPGEKVIVLDGVLMLRLHPVFAIPCARTTTLSKWGKAIILFVSGFGPTAPRWSTDRSRKQDPCLPYLPATLPSRATPPGRLLLPGALPWGSGRFEFPSVSRLRTDHWQTVQERNIVAHLEAWRKPKNVTLGILRTRTSVPPDRQESPCGE